MSTVVNATSLTAPPGTWNLDGMVFDAWLNLNHNTSLTITQHPVETGAAITDHSYINPRRFNFNIGMTDVIASPNVPGLSTRSINAYQALVEVQYSRRLLTLVSKYGTFGNILVESIDVPDDYVTKFAGRFTVNLVQIIVVDSFMSQNTTNPQATNITNRGQVTGKIFTNISGRISSYINGLIP